MEDGIEGIDYPTPEDVCSIHGSLAVCTCDDPDRGPDFGCAVCEWAYPTWERHDTSQGPVCNSCFES